MLKQYIGDSAVITIIGLSKNAGKTTVLRHLMAELSGERLALTSVGRDGESTDLTTGTEKPSLYIKEGDLFATARGMLALCDVTCGVEAMTGIMTPLGEVAVFRARSDGFVQLAGPSSAGQLPLLNGLFTGLGAQRILIDGAAGRRSLASVGVSGCAVLCAGASFDRDMDAVAAETAHVCALFGLGPPENPALRRVVEGERGRLALFTPDGEPLPLGVSEAGTPLWKELPPTPCALWMGGAVTDAAFKILSQRNAPVDVITEDPTHILAGRESVETFVQRGGRLWVRQRLRLAAVCANPWSAVGWEFPAGDFVRRLSDVVSLPVVNVLEVC